MGVEGKSGPIKALDDELREVSELLERFQQAYRRNRAALCETYLNRQMRIALRCTSGHFTNYGILLESWPRGDDLQPSPQEFGWHGNHGRRTIGGQKPLVLPDLVEVVEFKQKVIPSLPRLERFDNCDVPGSKPIYLFTASFSKRDFTVGDGEIHVFWSRMAVALGQGDGENVQTAADTVNNGPGMGAEDEWYRFYVMEAKNMLAGLRIDITEDCKRVTFLPVCEPPSEVWEIGFGPIDCRFGL